MAAKKLSEITATTTISANDIFLVTKNPTTSPTSNTISWSNMFANVTVTAKFTNVITYTGNVVSNNSVTANNLYLTYRTTPSSSGDVVTQGKFWFDNNYLYVAISNNSIKRVALSSF